MTYFLRAQLVARLLLIAAGALSAVRPAHADETISTDRPDFVESSDVVGKGRFQVEIGFASERSTDSQGTRLRLSSTPTLLRLGVSDSIELRVETDGVLRLRSQDTATSTITRERGFADASLGIKWHARDGNEDTGQAALAWLLHFDVDSGSRAFRGNGVRPSLRMVAEWELAHGLSVGVMPGLAVDRNDQGSHFASGILALTVAKSWTEDWRSFVEVAGQQIASAHNGGSVVTFDTGVAWLLNKSVQLDAAMSWGLTRNSPDTQWTLGLSFKY